MSHGPLKTQGLELLHDLEVGFPRGANLKEPERSYKVLYDQASVTSSHPVLFRTVSIAAETAYPEEAKSPARVTILLTLLQVI